MSQVIEADVLQASLVVTLTSRVKEGLHSGYALVSIMDECEIREAKFVDITRHDSRNYGAALAFCCSVIASEAKQSRH